MLLSAALNAVNRSVWGRQQRFRQPLYDSYGFSRLPATIEGLLTNDDDVRGQALPAPVWEHLHPPYEQVVLLFVDAFGWQFFQRYVAHLPFLQRFADHGLLVPMTSQFPSTTASHVTCIHMGQPVGQSGVYEWQYYEPAADEVIGPLTFGIAGQKRESLRVLGFTAGQILPPGPTFYQRLAARGVTSFLYQSVGYAQSTFTQHACAGANCLGYNDLAHGLTQLRQEVLRPRNGPCYHCFYVDSVDAVSHLAGPSSNSLTAVVQAVFTSLEEQFHQPLAGKAGKTLLLLTADHGQTNINPSTTVIINEDLPDLPSKLRTTRAGKPIRFAGSPRDLFLHVRDEHLADVEARLSDLMGRRAEVWRVADLLAQGFFGAASQRLLERLGNLVILPYEGESVFWRDEDFRPRPYLGHHGGLTPAEMDTGAHFLEL
jgi:hypothetical protein